MIRYAVLHYQLLLPFLCDQSLSLYSNVYDKFCFVGKSQISGRFINNVFTTKELQPFGVIGNVSPESPQFHNFYDKKNYDC